MPFTLWMHDRQIGETNFELGTPGRRRAGLFRPTAYGLSVLPGITAMVPALLAFGEMCQREGLDVDDDGPENAAAALDAFGGTPEGQRVISAAKQIAAVVVRDSRGQTLIWESLAISDLALLASLTREQKPGKRAVDADLSGDSPGYIVSLTLAPRAALSLADAQHLGAQRRQPAANRSVEHRVAHSHDDAAEHRGVHVEVRQRPLCRVTWRAGS